MSKRPANTILPSPKKVKRDTLQNIESSAYTPSQYGAAIAARLPNSNVRTRAAHAREAANSHLTRRRQIPYVSIPNIRQKVRPTTTTATTASIVETSGDRNDTLIIESGAPSREGENVGRDGAQSDAGDGGDGGEDDVESRQGGEASVAIDVGEEYDILRTELRISSNMVKEVKALAEEVQQETDQLLSKTRKLKLLTDDLLKRQTIVDRYLEKDLPRPVKKEIKKEIVKKEFV